MIFVIQYRPRPGADLKVSQEAYNTLEAAQRYIESRPSAPVKEPMTNYRYRTEMGEEYHITEVSLPWSPKKRANENRRTNP